MLEKEYIFTEVPEEEMWQTLLQYSYEANIRKYLLDHSFEANEDLVDNISGSILQAHEYYSAAKHCNLQIKPLLLYYGTTNLLYGISNMLTGQINTIHNHGMKIIPPLKGSHIGGTEIIFENPTNGGVHVFIRALGSEIDLTQHGSWTTKEMLSSIPELHANYKKCYGEISTNSLLLQVFNTPEGKVEKIHLDDGMSPEDLVAMLNRVDGFQPSYLHPVLAPGGKDLILRHKLSGKDISETSYSGQPFLRVGHVKNGKILTLPQIMYMYIALFSLGSLCRYRPEIWSPFVKQDHSGEKLLVEKFLFYASRLIPNYVINQIYGKEMVYSSDKYAPIDTVKMVGEHQVRELIGEELKKREERKSVRHVFEK